MVHAALTLVALFTSANLALAQAAGPTAAGHPPAKPPAAAQSSTILPGTYDLEIAFGGGVMDGTLVIAMVGDSLDAKLTVGEHAPPIKSVVRKGSHLTLSGKGDGVDVAYELDFSGDALVGKFTFNGDGGAVTGTRRK
jgi:hypothetical protein